MRISYVKIENFRNFRCLEVDLGQNIILIGENRTGKSNFIYALRLILDPSLPDQDRYLSSEDFWDGEEPFKGREIRVTIRLTDFADSDSPEMLPLSWLSHCLTKKVVETTAQLTYVYFNEKKPDKPENSTAEDYEYRIYPGDNPGQNFEQMKGMRKNIPLQVIQALRDIAGDSQSWRRSPLRRLIELSDINTDIFEPIAEKIQALNDDVVTSKSISGLQTEIQSEFTQMVGKICESVPSLSLSSITATELLRSLTLYMDGDKRRDIAKISLGLQNSLYLTLLSLLLDKQEVLQSRQKQPFLPLVALEEPEAHLHPHLQRLIFSHFLNKARTRKQPVIVSTHSPHLAVTADIRDIVLFYDRCENGADAISAHSFLSKLNERERKDLSRFLDITKAEMLFAKGVIFVEGDVELLLVKEFADIFDKPLDKQGISICNVSGTHFSHVAILAKELKIPFVILTDGDKFAAVNGLARSLTLLEVINSTEHKQIEQILEQGNHKEAVARLRKNGIFLNSWTMEVELIESGNHDIMKDVFIELGEEIDVKVRAGSANIDKYLAAPTDDNMKLVLTSIEDSRWGKGRYAHRLLEHVRAKADSLPDSANKHEMIPEYIRESITYLISAIEHKHVKD